jgi:hypothetical protein
MKQAISRNLSDPVLSSAPVIPTDRVSLLEMPEERTPVEELVQKAYANRPEIEQQILNLRNNEITLRAVKNNLLPVVDLYAFYGAAGLGGAKSPFCSTEFFGPVACDVADGRFIRLLWCCCSWWLEESLLQSANFWIHDGLRCSHHRLRHGLHQPVQQLRS